MSIRNLENEVKRRVKEAIKGIQVTDDKGDYVTPLVETGALPKEAVIGKPYILIQTTSINDDDLESRVEVVLLYSTVGISKTDATDPEKMKHGHAYGHWDVISVIDKLRSNFLKNTNFQFGIMDRRMKHEVFGEVKFPLFFLGESKLSFTVPSISPEDDYS